MTISLRLLFFVLLFSLVAASAGAQENAKLTGKITDKDSGEELVGASVLVVGTKIGAKTNIDGIYTLNLAAGKYDIRISYVGYKPRTIKDVNVKVGLNKQDVQLKADLAEAEEIVVQAEISNSTESALLTQQRKSLTVQDAISSEQIKKTADSDAGEAAKRVTGVSLVGGKFVYVRGLGERYSNTQLNGVTIPSPEPEKKVAPLDIIPSNLVENIITIKTFLPDQPGTFGGGLIRIKTKEFPEQTIFNVGIGAGLNTETQFKDIIGYSGGNLDFLGFDRARRLPSSFPSTQVLNDPNITSSEKAVFVNQLSGRPLSPSATQYMPNQSYSISYGDQLKSRIPIGVIASLTYSGDANFKNKTEFLPTIPGTPGEVTTPIYRLNTQVATYAVNWGGVLHFNSRISDNSKIGLKTTYNRTMEDESLVSLGVRPQQSGFDQQVRATRLRYVERQLVLSEFSGNHSLPSKSDLEWKVAFGSARRNEPDNRETSYITVNADGRQALSIDNAAGKNQRFFSNLNNTQWSGNLDYSIPFKIRDDLKAKVKVGAYYYTNNRTFSARRLAYQLGSAAVRSPEVFGVEPELLFTPQNIESGAISFRERTNTSDAYTAEEKIAAGYIMSELPLTSSFRLIGGLRAEQNNPSVISLNENSVPTNAGFNVTNYLPSANLIYSLGESMNFRGSYSQTIALPELREMAPFRFDDYRSSTYGNPTLTQSTIRNSDFRWEWYPRFGEIVSVSVFYKTIQNPIERIFSTRQSSSAFFTFVNGAPATNYGIEFEIRKRLDVISPALKDFGISTNVAFINSRILQSVDMTGFFGSTPLTVPASIFRNPNRPMQGQSPYVINANLSYDNNERGFSAILLYNIVGRRLVLLGGAENINDVYEEPRSQVDFTVSQRVFSKFQLKMSLRNLLDDRFLFSIGDEEFERYNIGRNISVSLSYSL
jgi:TonB-dependent receptor